MNPTDPSPAHTAAISQRLSASKSLGRRLIIDRLARYVVGVGGFATIACILAILLFITMEVLPLLRSPRAALVTASIPASVGALQVPTTDEYREILFGVNSTGKLTFLRTNEETVLAERPLPGLDEHRLARVVRSGKDQLLVTTDDGTVIGYRIAFDSKREDGKRVSSPRVVELGRWNTRDGQPASVLASSQADDSGMTLIVATPEGAPELVAATQTTNLFGDVQRSEVRHELPLRTESPVTALAVTSNGKRGFVGSADGWVSYWNLANPQEPKLMDSVHVTADRNTAVTALAVLIGNTSLVIGDASGKTSVWLPVRDPVLESGWRLEHIHEFTAHSAAVTAITPSPRDKGFITADAKGSLALRHSTSAQTLLWLQAGQGVTSLAFAPKANGVVAGLDSGDVRQWEIYNPHPEISFASLFSPIWYEGYEAPAYVWQSSGGTDDFEPKFSLIPLMIGTLKGTIYALLFAVPIAVLAAVYVSQFMHPRLRSVVKPSIEIMAALPSVVLGFLAGLWLAPILEDILPAIFAMLVVLPLTTFGLGCAWQALPKSLRGRWREGSELVVLLVVLLSGAQICLAANGYLEDLFFGGNFRAWLLEAGGLRFDQRNCLVVGFAMGFAVIPIIFTISEDALSNVPQRLTSASLALGATRWQTATRVVFPTASAGIFSAIMVGFGRAVGETMIVLMATGNTPIMDFNIFSGMRTLAANIAVEIPEAPYGSSLYRVLFLAALMLFIATFVLNTIAEMVRQRLRKRYQQM